MSAAAPTRLRTLADPHHFPALKPEYLHRRPALGLRRRPAHPSLRVGLTLNSKKGEALGEHALGAQQHV
jgi:arsenic resistance protein ArsH